MEGNASVYQVCPVSRITGEGRAEFLRAWGLGLSKRERGGGGRGAGRATQSVRGNYKSFKGTNLTVVEGVHQFIMYILQVVQPVSRGRSVRRGGGEGGFQQLWVA